jgi:hypothetical protein
MAPSEDLPQLTPPSTGFQWAALLAAPLIVFLVGIFFLPSPAGVEEERSSGAKDLKGIVTKTAPEANEQVDVLLSDRLRFVSSKLPTKPVGNGSRLKIDFHFEVLRELDRNWEMFVHIDRRDGPYRIHGDHFPTDGKYQTSLWQPGEFITDHFSKLVPIDAPPGTYDVWIGFYIGNERMKFASGDKDRHDGGNRIRAGTIKVE